MVKRSIGIEDWLNNEWFPLAVKANDVLMQIVKERNRCVGSRYFSVDLKPP